MNRSHLKGFTLIELVVSILIVSILAALAVNSFVNYARKGHRTDGMNAINAIALAQERYRSSNSTYGTLAQVGAASTSDAGYYTLAVSNTSATGYTITATAVGTQANDTEGTTSCTPLQLVASNGTITRTPAVCWPQ